MKNFSKKIKISLIAGVFVVLLSFVFSSPFFVPSVFAQTTSTGCTNTSSSQTTVSGQLPNPLCVSSVSDILYLAVDIATYIGVVLAVIFLIYAGFKYIAAQGNPDKISEAHHFLLAVIIGIAILIGADAIVNVIENTLTSAGVVNSSTFSAPTQSTTGTGVSQSVPSGSYSSGSSGIL